MGRVAGRAEGYGRAASSGCRRRRSVGLADPGCRRGRGGGLPRACCAARGGGGAGPGAGQADSASAAAGDARGAGAVVDATWPVHRAAGRGAGTAGGQAAGGRGCRGVAVAPDGVGAGVQRGAHDRGDVGVAVGADEAPGQRGGRRRQLHRQHRRGRPEHGADVFATVGNTEKKAGALNQALSEMFAEISARDVVMVMDADSVIVPEFLETAMGRLEADPDLIAVGGVFYGEGGSGLVGQLQRNEYTRYQRHISRRKGKVFVLTGTASLFRTYALKAVADSRGQLLPGDPGRVYDTLALTEDNEMTLSLKSLGAKMISPMQCRVVTEVMPTWRALWRQRMRWQRGALENIGAYGLTRATLALLVAADRDRLRHDRPQRLPPPAADHPARGRRLPVRLVLDRHRPDLRRRARRHRLGGRLARQSDRAPTADRARLRPRAAGRLRQITLRHRHRPRRGWNYVPRETATAKAAHE